MGRVGGGAKTNPPESFVTRNYLSASSFSLSKIARFGDFEEYCEPAGADSACHSECKPQPSHLDKPEVSVYDSKIICLGTTICFESNFEC